MISDAPDDSAFRKPIAEGFLTSEQIQFQVSGASLFTLVTKWQAMQNMFKESASQYRTEGTQGGEMAAKAAELLAEAFGQVIDETLALMAASIPDARQSDN